MPTPTDAIPDRATVTEQTVPLLVTIPNAASLLSISRSTVYELIWRHELEPVKIGRSVRLRMSDLEAFARQASANEQDG